jgi:hypothetical protein
LTDEVLRNCLRTLPLKRASLKGERNLKFLQSESNNYKSKVLHIKTNEIHFLLIPEFTRRKF